MGTMGFDKVFDATVRAMPLPSIAEEGIILVKDFLKKESNREKAWDVFQKIFDKDENIFKDILDGKSFDFDKLKNSKNEFLGQEKVLEKLNNQYNKWVEATQECDIQKMESLGNQIKKESANLLPTKELINKINNIDNTIVLCKSKVVDGNTQITDLEKEILNKIA